MKKPIVIIIVMVLIGLAAVGGRVFFRPGEFQLIRGFNWYESQTQAEIENANQFAQERLEKKYHIFVNGIFIDIGYDWDGVIHVPVRSISESLNWTVNWIPELELIQLLKDDDEAFVEIVNLFGKAYVDLDRLENLLRLPELRVHGGNIEIITRDKVVPSIGFNRLNRLDFYINEMKMTDRAVIYQGEKYLPGKIFALAFGKSFRYSAEDASAYIDKTKIECVFMDGRAYSTLQHLKEVIDTGNAVFRFADFVVDKDELLPVVYKGPEKKMVALTFDDYLGENVYQLLDILDTYNVKATFFIIGNSIESNSDLLKRLVSRGHLAANHSWNHLNCLSLTDDEVRAQLISTHLTIERNGGEAAGYFRPPGGYYDQKILRIAQEAGLQTVLWSLNSTDADMNNSAADIKRVVSRWVGPGVIITMHTNRENTIEALPEIIEDLRDRGYRFVSISEMLDSQGRN